MKLSFTFLSLLFFVGYAKAQVTFSPAKDASANIQQIRVNFSESMKKIDNPFTVTCDPVTGGYGNWADNNTAWVYNLEVEKDRWGDSKPLPGGASCSVVQNQALEAVSGAKYKTGTLTHEFVVNGPNVTDVLYLPGLNNNLRETEPVIMVLFDGDIDRATFINSPGSFLWYPIKAGYPADKILLSELPKDKLEEVFSSFKKEYALDYRGVEFNKKNWALVTVKQNLIPGADINLSVSGVVSAYAAKSVVADKDIQMKVRDSFNPVVDCTRMDDSSACMPEGDLYVRFNAQVNWGEAKNVYVEYVPADSVDGKAVKAYPSSDEVVSNWLSYMAYQMNIPVTDSARVVTLDFSKIKVAPETKARVVFPANLKDVDNRVLTTNSFELNYGSYSEIIDFPKNLTIMERNVPGNTSLPVSIMNLNQKVKVLKSGDDIKNWEPISDMKQIMDLIVAYQDSRNNDEGDYLSPLLQLGHAAAQEEVRLTGEKNKKTFLSLNYGANRKSGVYAVEVLSELSADTRPSYNLTLLTDLSVNLKKGSEEAVAWVTSYSTGMPVASAEVQVYDCNKAVVASGKTDANGLFTFASKGVSSKCNSRSYLLGQSQYFVAAKTKTDIAFTHSSYTAEGGWAYGSPGIEYFYSNVNDNKVYIHSLVGINLVKPGQTVPVQLTAVVPFKNGFKPVNEKLLPTEVQISSNNSDLTYDIPLKWKNGTAEFKWEVPQSAELGSYAIKVKNANERWYSQIGTDIEVSEFKVPLMTASVSATESGQLVKPTELKVSGLIRYANGIGAKDQDVEVSYFFVPTSLNFENYVGFDFVQGEYNDGKTVEKTVLPDAEQVAKIEGLKTDSNGAINLDLATEVSADGANLIDLLSKETRPYNMVVRMKYKDQMGEFQTASTSKAIYNSSAYVGTMISKGSLAEATLDVVSLGVDGKPYTNMSDLEVNVVEVVTHVIGEEVFGGFIKNTFENELIVTNWKPACNMVDGVAKCSAKGLKAGNYLLTAEAKSNGQKTYSKFKVDSEGTVTGENDYYYFDKDVKGIVIASDKENYKGGDEAKLTFDSPFENCSALVTLERADVVDSYVDNQACQNGFVKVKLSAEQAPNVFASVYFVTGRVDNNISTESLDLGKPSYRIGFSNLKIDWANYALGVDVKLDKSEYKPRDVATAIVTVKPEVGKLEGATVTVFAIEEKILELKNNDSMKILESLMGQRGHSVETVNTYEMLDSVAEVESKMAAEAALGSDAKGGPEGGSGSELESFQRKLFDALVSWETNVPVVNGVAQVSFQLNDKLTKFKVFAVVSDSGNNKYGNGVASYLSSQEVQTYSNISSVARTGDEYPATVTIQNNGKQQDSYTVVMDYTFTGADGAQGVQSLKNKVTVDKGGSVSVEVGSVKIPEGTTAVDYAITVYNENMVVVDKLTPPTQVVSPSVPLTVQDEFLTQVDGKETFTFTKDSRALPSEGSIDAKVFSSLVSSATYSIKKSVTEDIFADVTVDGKFLKALLLSDKADSASVEKAYAELLSQVDRNGFVKYYPGASVGNFWLTSDLVQIISMKPWALSLMPATLKEKLVKSFTSVIEGKIEPEYIANKSDTMAWTVASVKAVNALLSLDSSQVSYGEAVLNKVTSQGQYQNYTSDALAEMSVLAAMVNPKALMNSELAKYISEAMLVVRNTSAVFKGTASYSWWGYSDEIIATAKFVKAQSLAAKGTAVSSSDNYLDNLVTGLVQANKAGKWYTNTTRAWVLNGLTAFADTFESEAVSGTTAITTTESSIGAKVNWTKSVTNNGFASVWKNTDATVNVEHTGAGRPWVSVTAEAAVKLDKPNYQGLKVTKTVTNKSNPGNTYSAGDLIQVDLTIDSPSEVPHVALFDPIPSGANILSEGWGYFSSAQKTYSGYKVYFNRLSAGTVTLSYQYQLNSPGSFELPQTRVEALYEPGLFGEVPNDKMTVVK